MEVVERVIYIGNTQILPQMRKYQSMRGKSLMTLGKREVGLWYCE
jgi:hypothetical protein